MSAPTEPTKPSDSGAESPTTARPFELDDDDVPESAPLGDESAPASNTTNAASSAPAAAQPGAPAATEEAPAKPPRPLTEAQKNEMILKEAFPGVEAGVIKAVLSASRGLVEPAFNALLEMTDPDAVKNEPVQAPPPQPPRPQNRQQLSQLEQDELYARQLSEHYNNAGAYEARTSNRSTRERPNQGWQEDRERSFIDDDLPVIRDNLRQGFLETQTQVNSWISSMRKKLEETFADEEPTHGQASHSSRPYQSGRPSGDYDADPQVLSDDFARMRFAGDGTPIEPRTSSMGGFRQSQSNSPRPSDGRRVGFKEETEEINMYDTSPKVPPKDTPPTSASKASKWQPLSTMEPSPITDNDPFSLGDSEDERDAKDKPKETKDTQSAGEAAGTDSDRLKQAAAEAMADSLVDSGAKGGDSSAKKK